MNMPSWQPFAWNSVAVQQNYAPSGGRGIMKRLVKVYKTLND
tara:strand:+ start:243 stop:368 length:126 start_codon:yes stop_codon:yes gene_type:complete